MITRLPHWRAAAGAVLGLALLACNGGELTASLGPGSRLAGTPFGQLPNALLGRWSHIETATDSASTSIVTQTVWQFSNDGTATRTIAIETVLGAVLATSTLDVTWIATPGVLTLRFDAPSFQILQISYAIDYGVNATTLFLDSVPYTRVN